MNNAIFVIGVVFFAFGVFLAIKGLYGLWPDFFTERERRKEVRAAERLHSLQCYVQHRGELFSSSPRKKEENFFYGKKV